jgi:DNA-directed RNA polymerase specialized sigma24 family protein
LLKINPYQLEKASGEESQSLIISKFLKGDTDAFNVLFMQSYTPIFYYCKKLIDDTDIAKEIVSDTFLKIWTNRESIESFNALKTYLYKSARNLCIDYLKRKSVPRHVFLNLEYDLVQFEQESLFKRKFICFIGGCD